MLDSIFDFLGGQSESEKQAEELKAMDDHELADLGISRDQIDTFVASRSEPAT